MAGHPPAPGSLELVRRFVNTLDVEGGTDALAEPGPAAAWLAEAGLLPGTAAPQASEHARLLEVRTALRALLAANAGSAVDCGALDALDEAARRAPLRLRLDGPAQAELVPATGGWDAAVAALLAVVYEAMAAGTWGRLKVCREGTCQWAFYDASRNRSGTWCSMAVCGNRTKARAFRARRRPA